MKLTTSMTATNTVDAGVLAAAPFCRVGSAAAGIGTLGWTTPVHIPS